MEIKLGKKTIEVNKKKFIRGALTFTAGAGAYIIVRRIVKNNVDPDTLNFVGKGIVAVGAFFLANAVADKVSESTGKFFDECVDSYETINKATQETINDLRNATQA